MKTEFRKYDRKSFRLKGFDYSSPAYYFITICCYGRQNIFGQVNSGIMILSPYGRVVCDELNKTASLRRGNVRMDDFIVMPNHIHAIIQIIPNVGVNMRDTAYGQDVQKTNGNDGRGTACRAHGHGNKITHGNDGRGTARRAPTQQFGKPVSGSLPTIIRSFKSAVTKTINEIRNTPGRDVWQRNYFESIIRNEKQLLRIRDYIRNNPSNWDNDRFKK